jgi:hypothetical protein
MRFYPILLNKETSGGAVGARTGLPRLARGEEGKRILEKLARLSRPFGTEILVEESDDELFTALCGR